MREGSHRRVDSRTVMFLLKLCEEREKGEEEEGGRKGCFFPGCHVPPEIWEEKGEGEEDGWEDRRGEEEEREVEEEEEEEEEEEVVEKERRGGRKGEKEGWRETVRQTEEREGRMGGWVW